MGIKPDPKRPGTYIASYGKRHPITRQTYSIRRIGLKTKAEAKKSYDTLVVLVADRIRGKVMPQWSSLLEDYRIFSLEKGMTAKSVENYYICLKAHTLPQWAERAIDTITTDEIRNLVKARVGDKAASHQKNVLK